MQYIIASGMGKQKKNSRVGETDGYHVTVGRSVMNHSGLLSINGRGVEDSSMKYN